jgi:hypothetical protein
MDILSNVLFFCIMGYTKMTKFNIFEYLKMTLFTMLISIVCYFLALNKLKFCMFVGYGIDYIHNFVKLVNIIFNFLKIMGPLELGPQNLHSIST